VTIVPLTCGDAPGIGELIRCAATRCHSDTAPWILPPVPTPCVTCAHPDREEIDRALVLGAASMRALARRFGMDRSSLARHRQAHVTPALARVVAEREATGPRSALDRLEELHDLVHRHVHDSPESLPVPLVRELRAILDTIARIRGELDERPQVAVLNLGTNPEWVAIRHALRSALAPYPDARVAAGAALGELVGGEVA
jgi:transposase-like protein